MKYHGDECQNLVLVQPNQNHLQQEKTTKRLRSKNDLRSQSKVSSELRNNSLDPKVVRNRLEETESEAKR